MTITILCAGALARPHAAAPGNTRAGDTAPLPAITDGVLARALRRARVVARRRQSALVPDELPDEAWLRERFGLEGSVAACALPRAEPPGIDLLVRPVHLHVAFDHLVLAPLARLAIGRDEAEALAARADALLADEGLRLRVVTAGAWRLEALDSPAASADLAALATLRARSARMAAGRNIDAYEPSGAAARRWRQLNNLIQMAWFEHPVNAGRDAAGQLPVTGLWLEGLAGIPARRPFERVAATDAAITGLARRAGIDAWPLDANGNLAREAGQRAPVAPALEAPGDVLLAPDFWQQPVGDGDPQAWDQAWQSFERWFEAMLEASTRVAAGELRLVLTGERSTIELHRSASDRWKPWRRLRLDTVLREAS